jgi:aspartate racemase
MHIGLIGGIGPAATDFYYRRLISAFADRKAALELTIVHADTSTLLGNLAQNNVKAQVAIYMQLANRLVAAGADCVVVTSIAGHFCIDAFKQASPLPVIDMITEVGQAIRERRLNRIGILGTRTVMETRFYGGISITEVIPPGESDLEDVHQAYSAVAVSGTVTERQRELFNNVSRKLLDECGAEAIMLGGTDLALVFKQEETAFPLVDCAAIHVDAVVRSAIA